MPRLDFNIDINFETLKDFKSYFESLPIGAVFSGHYLKHVRTGLSGEKKSATEVYINLNGDTFGFTAKPSEFWNLLNNAPFKRTQRLLDKGNSIYDSKGSSAFYRGEMGYIETR